MSGALQHLPVPHPTLIEDVIEWHEHDRLGLTLGTEAEAPGPVSSSSQPAGSIRAAVIAGAPIAGTSYSGISRACRFGTQALCIEIGASFTPGKYQRTVHHGLE